MSSMSQNRHHKDWAPFWYQRYLTPESSLYLYKATIRPCMEYCSQIWGGTPQSSCLDLLDSVQWRPLNLIGDVLLSTLQPKLASPSLFYKYYQGRCSQELSPLVPHGRLSVRSTRFFESLHQYAVDIPRCKGNFYQTSFFPRTSRLWNSLSAD